MCYRESEDVPLYDLLLYVYHSRFMYSGIGNTDLKKNLTYLPYLFSMLRQSNNFFRPNSAKKQKTNKQTNKPNTHTCSLSLAIPRSTTDWANGTEDDP